MKTSTNHHAYIFLAGRHASSAVLESKPIITYWSRRPSEASQLARITAATTLIRTKPGPPMTQAVCRSVAAVAYAVRPDRARRADRTDSERETTIAQCSD